MTASVFPPLLFPPVDYFIALNNSRLAVVDCNIRHNKRHKDVHRFAIASPHGRLEITVPVCRCPDCPPDRQLTWYDICVSDHAAWWKSLPRTFETAYARTPYFDALWPEIAPLLGQQAVGRPVAELVADANALIRRLTGIKTPVSAALPPNLSATPYIPSENTVKYRQTGMENFGFVPALSILDYIFNIGTTLPEQIP